MTAEERTLQSRTGLWQFTTSYRALSGPCLQESRTWLVEKPLEPPFLLTPRRPLLAKDPLACFRLIIPWALV